MTCSIRVRIKKFESRPKYWEKAMKAFQDWTQDAKDKFREVLSSGNTKSLIEEFVNTEFTDVNTATNKFTAILNSAIEKVLPPKRRKAKRLINQKRHYSYDCQLAKRAFKKAQRQLRNNSENLDRRLMYIRENESIEPLSISSSKIEKLQLSTELVHWNIMIQNVFGKKLNKW